MTDSKSHNRGDLSSYLDNLISTKLCQQIMKIIMAKEINWKRYLSSASSWNEGNCLASITPNTRRHRLVTHTSNSGRLCRPRRTGKEDTDYMSICIPIFSDSIMKNACISERDTPPRPITHTSETRLTFHIRMDQNERIKVTTRAPSWKQPWLYSSWFAVVASNKTEVNL